MRVLAAAVLVAALMAASATAAAQKGYFTFKTPGGQVQCGVLIAETYKKGPFTCVSARAGLTCRNTAKHGFFLSKKAWRRI